jgi:hypothetical protein
MRFSRFVPAVAIIGVVLTMALSGPFLGTASVAAQGNSQNAKDCQKGGWQFLQTSDGTTFSNQGDCVSAAAQGAALVPREEPDGPIILSIAFRSIPRYDTCSVIATVTNAPLTQDDFFLPIWKRGPGESEHFYSVIYIHMQSGSGVGESEVTFAPNSGEVQLRMNDSTRSDWATIAC